MKPHSVVIILFSFIMTGIIGPLPVYALEGLNLPKPGVMVHLSPAFNPPVLKGIKVHPENPFRFDFILDQGDEGGHRNDVRLKREASKLVKYFLASLTIPEKDLWVNLSPYEKDRIVPEAFGQTEMGRDLLAQDYILKQITASLMYPEDEVGKKFWKRIYEEAAKKYGSTQIPVNTFNKVWIVPEKAVVYENAKAGTAYVVESRLKVMLEADYLAINKQVASRVAEGDVAISAGMMKKVGIPVALHQNVPPKDGEQLTSNIIREIILPELAKEVNEGKNFAKLRQVYQSLILATWYKKKIKDSLLSRVYADKNKIAGVNINDPKEQQKIYEQYLKAFKKGVYNFIKDDLDVISQQALSRKYFSGGFRLLVPLESREIQSDDLAMLNVWTKGFMIVRSWLKPENETAGNAVSFSNGGNVKEGFIDLGDKERGFLNLPVGEHTERPVYNFDEIDNPPDHAMKGEVKTNGAVQGKQSIMQIVGEERLYKMQSSFYPRSSLEEDLFQSGCDLYEVRPLLSKVKLGEGMNFTDLGSSDGRVVMLAALRGAHSRGIERNSEYFSKSIERTGDFLELLSQKFPETPKFRMSRISDREVRWDRQDGGPGSISLILGDYIKDDAINFREEDVIFYYFLAFGLVGTPFGEKLLHEMKPGSYYIEHRVSNDAQPMSSLVDLVFFDVENRIYLKKAAPKAGQGNKAQIAVHSRGALDEMPAGSQKGGIDLITANNNLQTWNYNGEIKFEFNLDQIKQFQNAPGFVPVIINIQPMTNLQEFLGFRDSVF